MLNQIKCVIISNPVKGKENIIEVTFSSGVAFDHTLYDVFIKAYVRGSNKFSYIPLLPVLTGNTATSVTYQVPALEGDYNYVSRIMNRLC